MSTVSGTFGIQNASETKSVSVMYKGGNGPTNGIEIE
jgi:hypothetical protein